jgi:AcrR family transcriptional regulator
MVTDNAMELIADGGVAALTFKAMSARIGCSAQAVHQWYGSRDELLIVVTATFCQRWGQWVWGRGYERALTALVPDDVHEVPWTRVLLAIEEQARHQADLAPMLADLRVSERQLMMRLFPRLAGPAGAGGDD